MAELSRLAEGAALELAPAVRKAGQLIARALLAGRKVLACGNGGSAADAQHFVAELVGKMEADRRPLPAIALGSDPSVVTAVSNDYGFENLFSRQVEAFGKPGDVLVAVTTSGRSQNVVSAVATALDSQLKVVALAGSSAHPTIERSHVHLSVPSLNYQRVQEIHGALLHAICEIIEDRVLKSHRDDNEEGMEGVS